jgi:hypothetical protein
MDPGAPPTPTFDHLGEPNFWQCAKCGECFLVYDTLSFHHICARGTARNPHVRVRTFYKYIALTPSGRVHSVHLVGALADDPLLRVTSRRVGGTDAEWECRAEGGELVYYPPAGMDDPRDPVAIHYHPGLQKGEILPYAELARRQLRHASYSG